MKVLNPIEFVISDYEVKQDLLEYIGLEIDEYKDVFQKNNVMVLLYSCFLDQTFKPELIVELFEGFVELKGYYYYDTYTFQFYHYGFYTIDGYDDTLSRVMNPKTLYHFIINCQQAGIELQFRKGCAK